MRPQALAAFLDLGLGQADEIECRQAVGQMCLSPALAIAALQVPVEVLVRSERQELQTFLIQDTVG